MRRVAIFLLLDLVLLTLAASAEPRKHWYRDPKWWIGEAIIAASKGADAHSTVRNLGNGGYETNPILGKYPSTRRVAGFAMLDFGAQTTYHALAWHVNHHVPYKDSCKKDVYDQETCTEFGQDRLGWRIVGYAAIPTEAMLFNGRAAAHNYQLPCFRPDGCR